MSKRPILKKHSTKRDTFVVEALEHFLFFLRKISYFYVAQKVFGLSTFFAVDIWVISCLSLSTIFYLVSFFVASWHLQILMAAVAGLRIFEVLVYLIFTMLFARPEKGTANLRSHRRWLVLLASNYLEIIIWFGMFYSMLFTNHMLEIAFEPHWVAILRESLAFMVANSSGVLSAFSPLTLVAVTIQNFVGLFLTLVVATRVISLLPKLRSADPKER